MKKLSNIEAELKESFAYKKLRVFCPALSLQIKFRS